MPSPGPSRRQSGHRAPGFDFFLGNNGDESSVLEFESESDDYSSNDEAAGVDNCARYENQLRIAKDKIQQSDEEIRRLNFELRRCRDADYLVDQESGNGEGLESECKILTLWEEHRLTREKLRASEKEIARLRQSLTSKGFPVQNLQDQLRIMHKELSALKEKIEDEKDETAKLHEIIARYKAEILEMREALANVKAEIAYKSGYIEELQLKQEMVMDERDDRIDQMSSHLQQMQVEQLDLMAGAEVARKVAEELRLKIKELEREVEKKQQIIVAGAEEKREAIRQLCFSLEHYRNGYHRLREVVMGQKPMPS